MEQQTEQQNIYDKRSITTFALVILFVSSISLFSLSYLAKTDGKKAETKVEAAPQEAVNPFDHLEISARSAYVLDVNSGSVIYEYNAESSVPLASLAKIMMALIAVEIAPPETVVEIRREYLKEYGDSGLLARERWKLKDLIDFSLTVSSNDGARAIASVAGAFVKDTDDNDEARQGFVNKMNEKAQSLGLNNMKFNNETGLDTEDFMPGAYGSAKDIAVLFEYVLKNHPDLIEATSKGNQFIESLSGVLHSVQNTNADVDNIPGIIASKTGYTTLAGGNLVIAFDAAVGKPVIVSVLGSTYDGRFDDVNKLVEATMEYAKNQDNH